ncbi:MAG TPA: citrate synthase 2 [Dermatophilaceae bacterium]|nr:citrate synthase 2 [Dermatophilaceae bacterium]
MTADSDPLEFFDSTFGTQIGEVDATSETFRYRGVSVADLVGTVPFEAVWSLLVEDDFTPTLPIGEPFPLRAHTGDVRVDAQSALAQLAPVWGFRPLHDIDPATARQQLARASVMAFSFIAESARGRSLPAVPQREVDRGRNVAERFLIRWRGESDPRQAEALDAYFVVAAEHGINPSTLTARVIASTGADVAACLSGAVGAISGPLHGGAPARVMYMLDAAEGVEDADRFVADLLDSGRRIMGFGHRIYRAEDPRATVIREVCRRLGARRYELAAGVEAAALAALAERHPERVIATNLEFWAAVLLDMLAAPTTMYTPLFICARMAGWSAHILEQHTVGRLVRPMATYVGRGARPPAEVAGWSAVQQLPRFS